MKKWIYAKTVSITGMANIVPKKSGIPADVWSDHSGGSRKVSHRGTPRAKVGYQGTEISVSIEAQPKILAPKYKKIAPGVMKNLQTGIDYIGRNYDLFLKHYLDFDDSFDDEDLFQALRDRGEYR